MYNILLKADRGHSFPTFWCLCQKLYLFYTWIKLYYTKALSNQALSLALDWISLLWRLRIPESFMAQQQPFKSKLPKEKRKKNVFTGWWSLPKNRENIKVKDLLIWWHTKFLFLSFFFLIPRISGSKTNCSFQKKKKKAFISDSVKDKLEKMFKSPFIVFLYFSEHFHFHLCLYLSWTRPCAICRIYYHVGKRLIVYDHVVNTLNILPDIKTFFYLKHYSFCWFMSLSWWCDLYRMIFNAEGNL